VFPPMFDPLVLIPGKPGPACGGPCEFPAASTAAEVFSMIGLPPGPSLTCGCVGGVPATLGLLGSTGALGSGAKPGVTRPACWDCASASVLVCCITFPLAS